MGRFKTPDAEESVGCNLIPMIDIMFLLLLFFMLGADMTQRELEEVILPKADMAKEDSKEKEVGGFTTINVFHDSGTGACAAYAAPTGVCADSSHWMVAIRGAKLNDPVKLAERLAWEASQELEPPDPAAPAGKKPLSKRKISIRADAKCLFGNVQGLIEACGKAGLYKVEVGAARPAPE